MKTVSLNGTWNLKGCKQDDPASEPLNLNATVPGCVQLDLSAAGYLPADLNMGENILEAEQFEDWQWWYEKSFSCPETRENVFLVFEGVDCIAHYYLNGIKIGDSENMFIAHEFNVSPYLREGENILVVHIESPVLAANKMDHSVEGYMTLNTNPADTAIRKAPHSYGWDIMPRAVTSGLWRDVKIEIRDSIYFSQLHFSYHAGVCHVYYQLECPWKDLKNVELEFQGQCGNSSFYTRQKALPGKGGFFALEISNPKLWWPYGYGDANVYDAVAKIYCGGQLVHAENAQFGLRTVTLERTDTTDGENGCFRF